MRFFICIKFSCYNCKLCKYDDPWKLISNDKFKVHFPEEVREKFTDLELYSFDGNAIL